METSLRRSFGNKRTHRTVDLTEDRIAFSDGSALTAHERAGNAAYCVHTLLKVNGEREKSMPSRGLADAVAVTRTAVSP